MSSRRIGSIAPSDGGQPPPLVRRPERLDRVIDPLAARLLELEGSERAVRHHEVGARGVERADERPGDCLRGLVELALEAPGPVHARAALVHLDRRVGDEPEEVARLEADLLHAQVARGGGLQGFPRRAVPAPRAGPGRRTGRRRGYSRRSMRLQVGPGTTTSRPASTARPRWATFHRARLSAPATSPASSAGMPQHTCSGQVTATPLRQRTWVAARPTWAWLNSTGVV